MPTGRKLKPQFKSNKVNEYHLEDIFKKSYSICLCSKHATDLANHCWEHRDTSIFRKCGVKGNANNLHPRLRLSLASWGLGMFGYDRQLKCDFCSGKYTLEFFTS